MQVSCPNCHARLSLEALAEDTDARKLFGLLSQHEAAAGALVQYLQLFKPAKQSLRWTRALRLAQEVTALVYDCGGTDDQLQQACVRTVSAMQGKRSRGEWQPLMSHGYFQRVLAAVMAEATDAAPTRPAQHTGPQSKRAAALRMLDED
jgi:hypothetical protein